MGSDQKLPREHHGVSTADEIHPCGNAGLSTEADVCLGVCQPQHILKQLEGCFNSYPATRASGTTEMQGQGSRNGYGFSKLFEASMAARQTDP